MPQSEERPLNQVLAEFQARRAPTMNPEALRVNIEQRRRLVDETSRATFVKSADVVPDFTLEDVEGGILTRQALLAEGPLVLIFFRFATCPACNIAIPHYSRNLAPRLRELGARLVAVSPQIPERLVDIKRKHDLDMTIATDWDNRLARHFGILYTYDEDSQRLALAGGAPIGEVTGTGTWELPMPTSIVIGQDGVVKFADVRPDWLERTEPETIIAAVERLPARRLKALAQPFAPARQAS